jgi:hypothetical protein
MPRRAPCRPVIGTDHAAGRVLLTYDDAPKVRNLAAAHNLK